MDLQVRVKVLRKVREEVFGQALDLVWHQETEEGRFGQLDFLRAVTAAAVGVEVFLERQAPNQNLGIRFDMGMLEGQDLC